MKRLAKTELFRRLHSLFFISGITFLLLYNIWDITLTDYEFNVGWSFFLFQKIPVLLIIVAIDTSRIISLDISKKIDNHKIILGYSINSIYFSQIIASVIESLILFVIDTISIIVLSSIRNYTLDISISGLIINCIIAMVSITVISVFLTFLSLLIPWRIVSIIVILTISLILFQKGSDVTVNLLEPAQTIFYNESENEPAVNNPLYISGEERDLYNLKLLLSPYAQVQYEKYILFENTKQKTTSSFLLKHCPYHFEFIILGFLEIIVLYYLGLQLEKHRFK